VQKRTREGKKRIRVQTKNIIKYCYEILEVKLNTVLHLVIARVLVVVVAKKVCVCVRARARARASELRKKFRNAQKFPREENDFFVSKK
jgi:hypothetical protein